MCSFRCLFLMFYALETVMASSRNIIDEFEMRLYHAQTLTKRRVLIGPTRASDTTRAEALAKTAQVVNKANGEYEAGKRYYMGYNELSDLKDEQYRAFLGSRPDKEHSHRQKHPKNQITRPHRENQMKVETTGVSGHRNDSEIIPMNVDWTLIDGGKYMTPIKNQGTCGSCWAFAGVSVVESRYAIEKKVQASILSVEQVLSCSSSLVHIESKFEDKVASSSEGCAGGMPFLTYAYLNLTKPHGILCESTYPYVMATNVTETHCNGVSETDVAVAWEDQVSDYKVVASNEQALLRAVSIGPVTANIDATGDGFRHYAGGIYDAQDCLSDGDEVNHAVVVVGYGQLDTGVQFWKIRNTWGTMWGEDGYMRILRGGNTSEYGPCNLYLYADYPVNLTLRSTSISGEAACPVPKLRFEPLSFMTLIGLASNQIALLMLITLFSVLAGMALYHGTEWKQNRKEAAGNSSYEDNYARWILPSRDQIAAALSQGNTRRIQRTTM